MADSLPPGFPAYLLPLRDAVGIEESPQVSLKPIVKPVASHTNVELDVMFPNGVFLTVPVFDDDNLAEIKKKLWIKYREMLKDIYKTDSQSASIENISSKEVNPTTLETQNLDTTSKGSADVANTSLNNKESNLNAKKVTKKHSFNVRSPSLNLAKLNPWIDKGEKVVNEDEKKEDKQNETLVRSFSMKQKVGNFVKSKFNKTGSVRVSSNDGYTRNAFVSPVEAKTKTSKMSTSLSTPVSPVDSTIYSIVDFGASEKTKQMDQKEKNDKTGEKSSKSTNPTEPLPIETTASLVLADFETDLNCVKEEKVTETKPPQSKLHALVNDDAADYAFAGITSEAKNEEFYDDSLRLIDLDLFMPMLKLIEVVGNKQEKMVNSAISQIVGKPLSELDRNRTTEFSEYRINMHETMVTSVKERKSLSVDERIFYEYPPEMDDFETLQLSTKKIRKDIEAYRHSDQHNSTDALFSSPSFGSLTDEVIYCNFSHLNSSEQQNKENDTSTKFPLIDTKLTVKDKENELTNVETQHQTKNNKFAETNSKAEYMEVIALKNSKRIVPKHCQTEYPLVLMGQQICTVENKKSKKNKNKRFFKQEKILTKTYSEAKIEKHIPFASNCSKSSSASIINPFSKSQLCIFKINN